MLDTKRALSKSDSLKGRQMATDYDAPRKNDDDAESLEALKERLPEKSSVSSDLDEVEHVGEIIDPDKQDELTEVVVIPPQTDEFTCMDLSLIHI